jgi:hypothetical protein
MTLAQARLAQGLIDYINSWAIENQDDLEQAYKSEMEGITDEAVIKAVRSELGL